MASKKKKKNTVDFTRAENSILNPTMQVADSAKDFVLKQTAKMALNKQMPSTETIAPTKAQPKVNNKLGSKTSGTRDLSEVNIYNRQNASSPIAPVKKYTNTKTTIESPTDILQQQRDIQLQQQQRQSKINKTILENYGNQNIMQTTAKQAKEAGKETSKLITDYNYRVNKFENMMFTGQQGRTIWDQFLLPVGNTFNIGLKTVAQSMEGTSKFLYNTVDSAYDWSRNKLGMLSDEDYQEEVAKRQAYMQENTTEKIWRDTFGWDDDVYKYVNENSFVTEDNFLGKTVQGMTQLLTTAALAQTPVGWELPTFLSSAGGAEQKAYQLGANDTQALAAGLIGGTLEVLTEKLGSGVIKVKGTGYGSFERLENELTNKISDDVLRYLAQTGVSAMNEGLEEVISGFGNALAEKLIYMQDKDLSELYSSKEAFQDFMMAAWTSMLSGGARNLTPGGYQQMQEDIQSGRSQITGYTQAEQSLIDAEVQSRLENAKANGEKVKAKKIIEQVEEDFREGNISVDKIEKTLGGEQYQKLMDQQNKLEELKNQKKILDNSKLSELTAAQNDQRQELKNQIEELESSTRSLQMSVAKDLMDKTSKSPLLQRSYYNANTLDTDTSKITNKTEKQTIENAKEAGIINKYKDRIEMYAKFAGELDTEIRPTTFDILKKEGKLVERQDLSDAEKTKLKNLENQLKKETNPRLKESLQNEINSLKYYVTEGFKDKVNGKDVITINLDSTKATQKIVMHEFKHVLERSDLNNDFNKYLFDYADKKGDLERITNEVKDIYKDAYGDLTQEQIDSEVSAKLIEEYLSDDKFVKSLNTKPTFKQKLKDLLDRLVSVFKPNSKEGKQLRELQKKYRELWNDAKGKESVDNGEQFAINKNFANEFDNWDKINRQGSFVLGTTSKALQSIGLEERNIVLDKSKLTTIIADHPEMTYDVIKRIPQLLETPTLIVKSESVNGRIVVFGKINAADGKPLMVAMELNPDENSNLNVDKIYKVASAYGKQSISAIQQWINKPGNVLYVDNKKNRTRKWLSELGLQLPVSQNQTGSNGNNISQTSKNVNKSNQIAPVNRQHSLSKEGLKSLSNEVDASFSELESNLNARDEQGAIAPFNNVQHSITKQSKQMLEQKFKNLTGDSLLVAEAKLGNYAFQQIQGREVEAPYNKEAMDIYEAIQNSKKTSSHLYHSTPADRIQSIIENGLQVGSKQNQEGVSSENKLYLSATEELADSFTPEGSVMLRISPNAKLENLDYDLLGGEGSYTITNNIEPKYLQVKENGKWVNLLKSSYANQTQYSLTKDNQGRELSKEQQEFFKDSKVRDNEGRLLEVYHGSKARDVNIFEYSPERQSGTDYGEAYYFTSDYNKAKGYQYDANLDERVANHEAEHQRRMDKLREANFSEEARKEFLEWSEQNKIQDILNDEDYIIENVDNISGETKKVYLNLTNPLIVDANGEYYYNVYPSYFEEAREKGNDGIIVKNVIDNPRGEARPIDTYIAFKPNQIKNVDNKNPTDNPDIRYSISRNARQDVENVLNDISIRNPVKLRDVTPQVLVSNGIKDLPMYENPAHIRKNILSEQEAIKKGLIINKKDHYHGLGIDTYLTAIDSLDNPRVIFKNKNDGSYLILTTVKDSNGNVIVAPIEVETDTYVNRVKIDTNRIRTVYGYEEINGIDLNDYIKHNIRNNVFDKIYESKKDQGMGFSTIARSYANNIPQNNNIVNSLSKNDIAPTSEWVNGYQLRGLEAPTSYEDIAPVNRTMNPLEISQLTPEDANTTPTLPTRRYRTGAEQSSFFENVTETTKMLPEDAREILRSEENIKYYDKITNEESMNQALDRLNENGAAETLRWFKADSKQADATDVAEGWILMKQYSDNGDYSSMVEVAKKMRDIGTQAGQTVQAFNIMSRLTPEGMVKYAQSELSEAYDQMVKNKSQKWIDENRDKFDLTPDEVQFIMDTMEKVKDMEDGYDKKVELAKIQKIMTDKLPPEKGQGIKAWMRISMLFNPKTQVRNVAGNALIMPVNSFSDIFASAADYGISKITGVRTTGLTNPKALLKGGVEGLAQATNDFRLGINTKNMEGNRFEIGEGKSFKERTIIGKSLNRTESLLNYVMDAGDRVFSQGAYENSIANQLKLNHTDTVTPEMIDIALSESLSRTWNDNNNYTRFVLNIRKGLNAISVKGYGLGDVLIPFAKTPANLTKAIVDYSPAGFINTLLQGKNMINNIQTGTVTAQQQHQFVQTLGKATAGSMLYVLAYALAKAGIATGESDKDKDTANFLKNTLGVSGYSIKVGDMSFTYDWAQPIAAPFAIMTGVVNDSNPEQALYESIIGSLDNASSVLMEQSFLQSINDVLNNQGSFTENLMSEIMELPSRAVPTFLKQINDMVDGTQRQTYVYGSPFQTAINTIKAKIPVLSQDLAPVVDTMGREIEKYGGKNNIFNVFLNPANVNTSNISEGAEEIYRVYQQTGDKTVMPRVAPYYINSKGEKVILTPDERADFQKQAGEIIEDGMQDLMNSSDYAIMTEEDKAAVIKNLIDYAYNKARKDVVDLDMAKKYNKVNKYISNGGTAGDYYINKKTIDDAYDWLGDKETPKTALAKVTTGDIFSYHKMYKEIKTIKDNTKQDKKEVFAYVQDLNLDTIQKAIIIKQYYSSYDYYNREIVQYVASRQDLNQEEKYALLESMKFKINKKTGAVSW